MMLIVRLFIAFLGIGIIGFGGGLAILPLIYQSVSRFAYISQEEFASLFGISQATPGPIAINAATYVGYKVAGIPGSIAATLGVVLPSMVFVVLAVKFLNKYREHDLVKGAFLGIRPATVGMITAAIVYVGKGTILKSGFNLIDAGGIAEALSGVNFFAVILAVMSFVLAKYAKLGAIWIILMMGIVGALSAFV